MAPLPIFASVATIGSFFINGVGLGHMLTGNKDSDKTLSTIIEEARQNLSSALAILNSFQAEIQRDFLVPLVARYKLLDVEVTDLERTVRSQKRPSRMQPIKSYKFKVEARETLFRSKFLYRDIRVASDGAVYSQIIRNNDLDPSGRPVPYTPHPLPVSGCSAPGPFQSKEYKLINLSTSTFQAQYPPRRRVGSSASNPFRDPTEM